MNRFLVISLIILQTASLKAINKLINSTNNQKEQIFWNYFTSQVDNLEKLSHSYQLQKVIHDKLSELYPGLGFGCQISQNQGRKEVSIFITAYGDTSKFPTIIKLIETAPKNILVRAFSPPAYLRDTLSFNNKSFDAGQIEFTYKQNNDKLDISLYLPILPAEEDNEFENALQTLLVDFLGEYQFTKIGYIDIVGMDKKSSNETTNKLKELKILFETFGK